MLKALIKTRILALLNQFTARMTQKRKKSNGMIVLIIVLAIYVIGCFVGLFAMFFGELTLPFHSMKIDWLYFGLAALTSFALMFVGSLFTTQAQLYNAKDNEMLLSMPIPPNYILFSRMILILVLNLIFELLVMLPCGVIYATTVGASFCGVLFFVLLLLALPLFSTACSALMGFIIAKISSKMRNKSLITVVFSMAFMIAYFLIIGKMNDFSSYLIAKGDSFAISIKGTLLPVFWFGNAIASGDFKSFILILAILVIPFLIAYFILSKTFISITTTKNGFRKNLYKQKSMAVSSARAAVIKKELKHLVSSPIYIMNGMLGCIFCVIGAIALIIKRDLLTSVLAMIPQFSDYVAPATLIVLLFISATNNISAPSISLEGKNLWILKSIPISEKDILFSKVYTHCIVCMPCTLFISIVCAFITNCNATMKILMIVTPLVYTYFAAVSGVCINLKHPKFDWTNEVEPIKQGVSIILSMLLNIFIVLVPAVLLYLLSNTGVSTDSFFVITTVIIMLVCFLLNRWLETKGKMIFSEL